MSSEDLTPEEKLLKVIQNGGEPSSEDAASELEATLVDESVDAVGDEENITDAGDEIIIGQEEETVEEAAPIAAMVVEDQEPEPAPTELKLKASPEAADADGEYKPPAVIGAPAENASASIDNVMIGGGDADEDPSRLVGLEAESTERSASRGIASNLKLDRIGALFSLRSLNAVLVIAIVLLIVRVSLTVYTVSQNDPELPQIDPANVKKLADWKAPETMSWASIGKAVRDRNIFGPNENPGAVVAVARSKPRWKTYASQNIVIYARSGDTEVILRDNKQGLTYILEVGDLFGPDFDESRMELKRITSDGVVLAMEGEELTL